MIFQALLSALSLPLSCLSADTIHGSDIQPTNIADIQRALTFLQRTDELVWRRSTRTSGIGGPTAAVYDEKNITALMERLSLWEEVVRRSRL